MGFSTDTAITVNADLTKYFFEQSLTKVLRDGESFTALHQGVVNELIARLRAERGVDDASTITNTADWKPYLCAKVLEKVFAGITPRGGEGSKATYYAAKAEELWRATALKTSTTVRTRRGLPCVVNVDRGTRHPTPGASVGSQIAATAIDGFDLRVIEGE